MNAGDLNDSTALRPGAEARAQFPIFSANPGKRLCYLDTAASSQKPKCVIDRLSRYFSEEHANIHRGAYALSAQATINYDQTRAQIAKFIGAKDPSSIIFTRGTTESVNLVARASEDWFKSGDVILLSLLEHHSNIVPWQMLAKRRNLKIEFVDVSSDGRLDMADLKAKAQKLKPKLVAVTNLANAIGTLVAIDEVAEIAHSVGAIILVDAAQSAAHLKIDVEALDVDFLAFSGHKLYGPTGIGVLYGRKELLQKLDPFMGGGDMIKEVTTQGSTWAELPAKFEAGTPPIAEAIALGQAIALIERIGVKQIQAHEDMLLAKALDLLSREGGVTVYGPGLQGGKQASIVSFNVDGVHAHDLSTVADSFSVQLRAGHHCAMPLLMRLGIGSSARISFGVYSEEDDLPPLIEAIRQARKMFT